MRYRSIQRLPDSYGRLVDVAKSNDREKKLSSANFNEGFDVRWKERNRFIETHESVHYGDSRDEFGYDRFDDYHEALFLLTATRPMILPYLREKKL